jgi:hypothetical protein
MRDYAGNPSIGDIMHVAYPPGRPSELVELDPAARVPTPMDLVALGVAVVIFIFGGMGSFAIAWRVARAKS